MSARACIRRRPSCFSRPTGSILGLYTAQPLPHLTALAPPSCLGMYLSGVSKLLSCLVKYLLHHVSGLLRPPCLTPAFQGAWSCIFKGFRNCYVARFSQAWKALKPQKHQKAPAFQAAWSCIFKGFRNCYVARFSQAWKALKPQKPQTV